MIRIPAAECWVLPDTVVLKLEQAANGQGKSASPTGAFKWIIDPESGECGQGAAQPGS